MNDILTEISFLASKSSGPGGQHVNKVNTKMTLNFDIQASSILNDEQKKIILDKLASRINKEGKLSVTAQNKRSQLQNKEMALRKCDKLLAKAFAIKKPRKLTKPKKSAILKRLDDKKKHSEKKSMRRRLE